MTDFTRAMRALLDVFSKELDSKVTAREVEGFPRLGFLAIPGTEYSDRIYREFYPRKETGELMKATDFLRQIVANRRRTAKQVSYSSPVRQTAPRSYQTTPTKQYQSTPSKPFSLPEFTETMQELLNVFTNDLGRNVSTTELGGNVRLSFLAQKGVEYSDLIYKEFYPNRETEELKRAVQILKDIASSRRNGFGVTPSSPPKRLPQQQPYGTPQNYNNYNSPQPQQNTYGSGAAIYRPATSSFMVFDYETFTMKPVGTFI